MYDGKYSNGESEDYERELDRQEQDWQNLLDSTQSEDMQNYAKQKINKVKEKRKSYERVKGIGLTVLFILACIGLFALIKLI